MRIRIYTVLLGLVWIASSCSKESLEVPIRNNIGTANFFQTQEDAEASVIGAYDLLQADSYFGFDYYVFGDVRADNSFAGGDNPNNFAIDNFTLRPTNDVTTRFFRQVYRAIGRANSAIDGISQMDKEVFDGSRKDALLGEALFLRALHYYNLVQFYGGVPLVTAATTTLAPDEIRIPRNSETEVYQQIVRDLQQAVTFLDGENRDADSQGRANAGSAEALLAKVRLIQGDYNAVLALTESTMSRGFSLVTNFDDLFNQQNDNNSEVLFAIQYAGEQEGNVFPELILPTPEASFDFLKFNTPTPSSNSAFETNDIRLASSIVERNGTLYVFKWRNGNAFNSADNSVVLRYADVLLMRAEALNQTGRSQEAITLLNQIRNRAGLPDYADSTETTALDNAIFNERRVEFMFEGQRFSDLKRKGFAKFKEAIQEAKNIDIQEFQLVFPIPQGEIDRNDALNQNPGY